MKRLVITLDASRDLAEISDYLLVQSVEAGDRFVEQFEQKCQHLARFPYIGKSYAFISEARYPSYQMDLSLRLNSDNSGSPEITWGLSNTSTG